MHWARTLGGQQGIVKTKRLIRSRVWLKWYWRNDGAAKSSQAVPRVTGKKRPPKVYEPLRPQRPWHEEPYSRLGSTKTGEEKLSSRFITSRMNFVVRIRESLVKSILISFCLDIPKSAVFINKISLQISKPNRCNSFYRLNTLYEMTTLSFFLSFFCVSSFKFFRNQRLDEQLKTFLSDAYLAISYVFHY